MNVFLVDGTYELFRHFYAVPPAKDVDGREVGAVRGVLGSVLSMLEGRRDAYRRRDRPRHRVVPQRPLAGLNKTGEGGRPRAPRPVRPARGGPRSPRGRGVADDGPRGGRRAGVGGGARGRRPARGTGVHLHPGQGSGAVRDGDAGGAVRPARRRAARRGRRPGEVRSGAGVDSRLSRPRRRRRRRLSRAEGLGRQVGPRRWSGGTDASTRYPTTPPTGTSRCGARGASRPSSRGAATSPCGSATLATLRTDARLLDSVDDICWNGPRPAFFDLCARLNVPGYFKRVRALTDRSAKR